MPDDSHRTFALVATPDAVLAAWPGNPSNALSPYERERVRSLRTSAGRDAYVAAHLLARQATRRLLHIDAAQIALQQRCGHCGGPHGKPTVQGHPGAHLSFSHCDVAVAAIASSSPVAIDVEQWSKVDVAQLQTANVFAPRERAALNRAAHGPEAARLAARFWVLKECLIKLGSLSLDAMHRSDFGPLLDPQAPADQTRSFVYDGLVFSEHCSAVERLSIAAAGRQAVEFEFAPLFGR